MMLSIKKWKSDSSIFVKAYQEKIGSLTDNEFTVPNLKTSLEAVVSEKEVGFGKVMMPVRIATTGQGFGPDLFSALALVGKEEVIRTHKYCS